MIPIFGIILWIYGLLNPVKAAHDEVMPLFQLLLYFTGNSPIVNSVVALLILILQSFMLNKLIENFNLLGKRSYLPGVVYMLCMSALKSSICLHPILLVNVFILLSSTKLYSTYRKEQAFSELFDSALFLSIGTLFYYPAILFVFMLWIYLLVFRGLSVREWLATLVGLALPYLFVFMYYFWNDSLGYFLIHKISFRSVLKVGYFYELHYGKIVLYALFLILFVVSISRLLRGLPVNTILARKILYANIWQVLFCFLIAIIAGGEVLFSAFIPLSIYFSHYFVSTKKILLAEILFMFIFIAILANQYFTFPSP